MGDETFARYGLSVGETVALRERFLDWPTADAAVELAASGVTGPKAGMLTF